MKHLKSIFESFRDDEEEYTREREPAKILFDMIGKGSGICILKRKGVREYWLLEEEDPDFEEALSDYSLMNPATGEHEPPDDEAILGLATDLYTGDYPDEFPRSRLLKRGGGGISRNPKDSYSIRVKQDEDIDLSDCPVMVKMDSELAGAIYSELEENTIKAYSRAYADRKKLPHKGLKGNYMGLSGDYKSASKRADLMGEILAIFPDAVEWEEEED